ncbi:unnamed protein product [Polarella glacialis]|uniref:DNA ligase IV n=2 Tax=Polarella glacialis TaxID=89957 RepID=A0A813GAC1_POLGL|nr:unnamed protein product [Polarella glacialis]
MSSHSHSLTSCDAESFHRFCLFLESLHLKKKGDKLQALEQFLRRFDVTCDLYPLLRLLLPGVDHERGAYGLKESNLAKLYADMLALPEAQRQRLLHWKDPALQEGYRCAAGDFASVLHSVVENRAASTGQAVLTIGELNAALDRIHNAADAAEKRTHLLDLVRRASAMEQKWIAKIILKDLKVGFSHESVLRRFHPDAMELYNRSSMLKQVLDQIRGQYVAAASRGSASSAGAEPPGSREAGGLASAAGGAAGAPGIEDANPVAQAEGNWDGGPVEAILFSKFKPMLAQRLRLDSLAKVMGDGSKSFSLEPKYDGERMLVHLDIEAKRVELYTRNSIDYTSAYGPSMRKVFLEGLIGRQAVLDGEMLSWDEAEQSFLPFGANRTTAQAGDPMRHLSFVAFDVLFYCDSEGVIYDLRRTRLQARQEFLARILRPKEHWLEVVPTFITSSAAEVQARLEGAIEARLEGLVLKDTSSKYYFNSRKGGWYKIKPEYDGLLETLDLLVVGAYFGDSLRRRAGNGQSLDLADNCSQFLLAALRGNGSPGGESSVITVGRVGTGYSNEKLREIRARLRPHLRRYDPHRAPAWMNGWRGGKTKPDAVIDIPAHGFVMEVRAAELLPTEEYEFSHTLRFPRAVTPIREDKDWTDANTEQDLREFIDADGRGALTSRRVRPKVEVKSDDDGGDTDEGDRPTPSGPSGRGSGRGTGGGAVRARTLLRGRSFGVLEGFRPADTAQVPVASELLKGAEVFVVNGDAQYSKADLETFVVKHGGSNVQNFLRGRTSLVVAASIGDLRTKNLAKTAHVDIILYSYLFECLDAGRMLPLKPRHLLATSPETKESFKAAFDEWGDAFYEEVSSDSLKAILGKIPEDRADAVPEEIVETLALHPRLRPPRTRGDPWVLPWQEPDAADGGRSSIC